ncbi:hypothetical protein SAMN02745128_02054 [Legionella maceachernii]|nr:hypothetical protein SAMN02745128_02054 [Legionella maceachernii]
MAKSLILAQTNPMYIGLYLFSVFTAINRHWNARFRYSGLLRYNLLPYFLVLRRHQIRER